jgi:hypothetical protein
MLGTEPNQGEHFLAVGRRDTPMDIIERCFFVTGMTCFFLLIGLGLLSSL